MNFYFVLCLQCMVLSVSFPTNVHVAEREGANHCACDRLAAAASHASVHGAAGLFDVTQWLSHHFPALQNCSNNIDLELVPRIV